MTNVLLRKSFLVKLLAVVVTVALMLTVAPFAEIANFALTANAEEEYDYKKFGTVTPDGNQLTAVPNNGVYFRGWYKDGKEVSYNETITLNSGETAEDYTPIFYDFNLLENGDFENGNANGWYTYNGSQTTSASVSSTHKKSGSYSLVSTARGGATYYDFKNLEVGTQYTISFSYYIPPVSGSNYLSFVSVLGKNMTLTSNANSGNDEYLAAKRFDSTAGACTSGTWKDVSITFYTDQNTTARLAFTYVSSSQSIYIDDVSITRDVVAAPTYFNEDFTSSVQNWKAVDSNRAKIALVDKSSDGKGNSLQVITDKKFSTNTVYSAPFMVKKGVEYTLSFYIDLSQITYDTHTQVFLSKMGGVDDRYSYEDGFTWKSKNPVNNKTTKINSIGSFITFASNKYSSTNEGKVIISVTFTAHESSAIYLNIKYQDEGTFTIDDLKIQETESVKQYQNDLTLAHVGSAIRTKGVQGLRYKTEIDKRFLISDMPYGIRFTEYGTLAIKTEYLNDEELTLNGSYTYNNKTKKPGVGVAYSFEDGINKVFEEDANKIHFTGVLTGIGTKNYNTNYTTRAYFKYVDANGTEGIIYTPQDEIAIYPVAKAAYSQKGSNNGYAEPEQVRKYLLNNIITRYTDNYITVDSTSVTNDNFQGIASTVYHGTVFFEDTTHGRKYTKEQAAIEMDRLKDSGITNVRTRFSSEWMWDNSKGWNWESAKMKAFYEWAEMLTDRGISLTINIGWHLVDFTDFYEFHFDNSKFSTGNGGGHSSIKEVNYLHGYTDAKVKINNKYNEDSKASVLTTKAEALGLDLTSDEYLYFSVAAVRYAEWGKQALEELAKRGINVEYIMPFTETGYHTVKTGETEEIDPTYCYDEWILMTMALHDALKDAGIRDNYKLIGPSQSEHKKNNREVKFIEYIYGKIGGSAEYKNMININSMHCYPNPGTADAKATIYSPSATYEAAYTEFDFYNNILTDSGQTKKEFWVDEYFVKSKDVDLGQDVPMVLTQFAAGFVAGMKTGIDRILSWQMFDTLWDADATHTTGEFVGGIHVTGTCPRLIGSTCKNSNCKCKDYTQASYTPRTTYYGINLLGKHMNDKNGADVLTTKIMDSMGADITDTTNGLYSSTIKRSDGKIVILVVNTSEELTTVKINDAGNGLVNSFTRYVYDPYAVKPDEYATSIASDNSLAVVDGSFSDAIPAQSFAIYVQSDVQYGDVDMDGGNLFD